jgi:hypothetical protein
MEKNLVDTRTDQRMEDDEAHKQMRTQHFDEEESKYDYEDEDIDQLEESVNKFLDDEDVEDTRQNLTTPKDKHRNNEDDMDYDKPRRNNAGSAQASKQKRASDRNQQQSLSVSEGVQETINVRVEELQSKMRSKKDMYHVLYSRSKIVVLIINSWIPPS